MSSAPLARALASWFGVGFLPRAPGTFGTLAAVPLAFAIWLTGHAWAMPVAALVVGAAGVACGALLSRSERLRDPPWIVIDEVAGYLLACSFSPPGWRTALLAFVLFRVLDIWKPGPIQRLEELPGGWGIMADDLGAGLLAGALTALAFGVAAGRWGPLA